MSVYIKGMEMPKERESFTVTIKYNGTVLDTETGMQVAEAYELPPHGRLIDADALKLSHCKECTLYPDKCLEKTDEGCDWESIYHIEHCAPTIITADKEDGE